LNVSPALLPGQKSFKPFFDGIVIVVNEYFSGFYPKYHEYNPGPDWAPIVQKEARKLPGLPKSPKQRYFGKRTI
jgi:hypothetical protein